MQPWTVVLPLRTGRTSKSRLSATLPGAAAGPPLAQAMALDVITAALDARRVERVVLLASDINSLTLTPAVTTDPRLHVVPDPPQGTGDGLNASLRHWLASDPAPRAALLMPDLPCLSGPLLDDALARAEAWPASFVPDQNSTGTVLLAGRRHALRPAFGPESARRHAAGAHALVWDAPALRQDVDTANDLAAACTLGLGVHTAGVLAELGLAAPGSTAEG